ncbi:enoyl-CoA hydratase/isomerase family protein [Candidatus Poriferisocius sp.]|uniref:enoyl-CoA hydratase/isomerase family protein n=1 Tax=Candidatus Poriferisocius sp. TaxID=3101276 RepID=UPI003B0281D6
MAVTSPPTVSVEKPESGIALITMSRPERLNALSPELIADLHKALEEVERDRSQRVVVLTGAGRGFCAGADLKAGGDQEFAEQPDHRRVGAIYDMQLDLANLMLKIYELRVPVIAAVNGAAVGGGFAIALHCDVRVAAESARFGSVFIKVGLSSLDVGNSYLLPRLIGASRARELMLTGRIFDAAEADRIGLVSRVVPDGQVVEAALEVARQIAANNEYGVWMTKLGANATLDAPSLRHAMELENRTQVLGTFTGNMAEASEAFREGREPRWNPL